MDEKKRILIIEDHKEWLDKLSSIIEQYFNVSVEKFSLFSKAEIRLMDNSSNFDLLITDIFPDDVSKDAVGLKFANFVTVTHEIPVIVVTGQRNWMKITLRDYNVLDVFYKGDFDNMDFVYSVSKVIKTKKDVVSKEVIKKDDRSINKKDDDRSSYIA